MGLHSREIRLTQTPADGNKRDPQRNDPRAHDRPDQLALEPQSPVNRLPEQPEQRPAPTVILVGGSVRAAAEDAVAGGYRVIAVDRFGDADLLAAADHWEPLGDQPDWGVLLAAPYTWVVPTGGFRWDRDPPPAARVAYPSADRLRELEDPLVLSTIAADSGIGFPLTQPLSPANLAEIDSPHEWLLKPIGGTGGVGIRPLVIAREMGLAASLGPIGTAVLQQRIRGRSFGVSFLARWRSGRRVVRRLGMCVGLTHRGADAEPFLYGGSVGPAEEDTPERSALLARLDKLADRLAERGKLVGLFNLDLIRATDGGWYLLEVNPRYSASMELLAGALVSGARVSLIDWHLVAHAEASGELAVEIADRRLAWGEWGTISRSRWDDRKACKCIVYARRDFPASEPSAWRARAGVLDEAGFQFTFHDLPVGATPRGAPLLTVIVRGGGPPAGLVRRAKLAGRQINRWDGRES